MVDLTEEEKAAIRARHEDGGRDDGGDRLGHPARSISPSRRSSPSSKSPSAASRTRCATSPPPTSDPGGAVLMLDFNHRPQLRRTCSTLPSMRR